MWPRRTKSRVRIHHVPPFACSSFKDIQNLFSGEESPVAVTSHNCPSPNSGKPSICHRVRQSNTLLRSLSLNNANALSSLLTEHVIEESEPVSKASPLRLPSLPENGSDESRVELNGYHAPLPLLPENRPEESKPLIRIAGAEKKIVVYHTSLRVVRSTFEDCKDVLLILRGFRVSMDERDLSMDSSFTDELQRILGASEKTKLSLPRVFIGGRYIGGAEEVRRLHETGELKKYIEGLSPVESNTCETCGGYRFILCEECNGSHKCYTEKGGFRSCTVCNENGLIRCPSCCCEPLYTL